ncbi:MAG TPA: hypothetical protein VM364_18190 [Vicinamibacterales bacterium]|nr:hypothetical protein [Vicinamibacterales bacterium]
MSFRPDPLRILGALVALAVVSATPAFVSRVGEARQGAGHAALAAEARQALARGDAAGAIPPLSALHEAHPHTLSYMRDLAAAHTQAGREEAVRMWELVAERSATPAAACPQLAIAYERLGRADAALRAIERCLALLPEDTSLMLSAARGYRDRGDTQKAKELHERALSLDPASFEHARELAILDLEEGYPMRALQRAEQAVSAAPQDVTALHTAARALLRLERSNEARGYVERAMSLEPDNADLHLALGLVEEAEGNLEAAFNRYNRALVLNPRLAEASQRRDALRRRRW